ncbi:MAG: molecular chaperone Hsp90 [Eubacterium sp.]|nr:molecular chaperone Hsp90 [Eubacterium sp.]
MLNRDLAQAVLDAPSACAEFKQAAQNYINSIGTDKETEAAEMLIAEAKEDIAPIDGTIAFFESDMAKQIFGDEVAAQKLAHAKEIKADGAIYCDCPGCIAALNIINKKNMF